MRIDKFNPTKASYVGMYSNDGCPPIHTSRRKKKNVCWIPMLNAADLKSDSYTSTALCLIDVTKETSDKKISDLK